MSLILATSSPVLTAHLIVDPIKTWTTPELKTLATEKAQKYHLNVKKFLDVIECESEWKIDAVGDGGASIGLAQFYYPYRWGLSTTTAKDPDIALETMAQAWHDDRYKEWSCWWIITYPASEESESDLN